MELPARLGFVGTGAITEAIIRGLLKSDLKIDSIVVSPRNEEIAKNLAAISQTVRIAISNQDVVDTADLIVLAVRPQIAREVISAISFPTNAKIISLIATMTSEVIQSLVGNAAEVVRAIPLPAVAEGTGVTAVFPESRYASALFSPLGNVVNADSLAEFNIYAAVSGLMGTYFGMLDEIQTWMVECGASETSSRQYLATLLSGLSRKVCADEYSLFALRCSHTTPNGLNELAWSEFKHLGGDSAIRGALDTVLERIEQTLA
ncbi:pyrroline-5-carboxylate reductase [Ochrobactrum chromiisoli]|uniref:Pyrroline-5-carboxylate reductase n=1 Tax=Ochrobactrum chromiisoli TaxID=2993941 RepID=A0ABT3QSK2_9HYPH|nr:pyrroline-5-carboxylate reductase [Ochrobactrum chromiisoli]MCX2698587.1 pyrroline-5-carboxylate reductase [Ochrobactrum chromiisoli]